MGGRRGRTSKSVADELRPNGYAADEEGERGDGAELFEEGADHGARSTHGSNVVETQYSIYSEASCRVPK